MVSCWALTWQLAVVSAVVYQLGQAGKWCEDTVGCATIYSSTVCQEAVFVMYGSRTSPTLRSGQTDVRGCGYQAPFLILSWNDSGPVRCGGNGYNCLCQCANDTADCPPRNPISAPSYINISSAPLGSTWALTCPPGGLSANLTCAADPISGVGRQWLLPDNTYAACKEDPAFCPAQPPTPNPHQTAGCPASPLLAVCAPQCEAGYVASDMKCFVNGVTGRWTDRQGKNEPNMLGCRPITPYYYKTVGSSSGNISRCEDVGCESVYSPSECAFAVSENRDFSAATVTNVTSTGYPTGCSLSGYTLRANQMPANGTYGICAAAPFSWTYADPLTCICRCATLAPTTGYPTAPTTGVPTSDPTRAPTPAPTAPTPAPTSAPTAAPTPAPTSAPTPAPTSAPTNPTRAPTPAPTAAPTSAPTNPTRAPTPAPTPTPTSAPTSAPSSAPTNPTRAPTPAPTTSVPTKPTRAPTSAPTGTPTSAPTPAPTSAPTPAPTSAPTGAPTSAPTPAPTLPGATNAPTSSAPTQAPTATNPSSAPTAAPTEPAPSSAPTQAPTERTGAPTQAPTESTGVPTQAPTESTQSGAPTQTPTESSQSRSPTQSKPAEPTQAPSLNQAATAIPPSLALALLALWLC